MAFSFGLIATDGAARAGEMTTAHGIVHTPASCRSARAAVKGVHHDDVRASGAEMLLANTYHLMLRPGAERIAALGGLQNFMRWPYPILTDSGGFQVMSLSPLRKSRRRASPSAPTSTAPWWNSRPNAPCEVQILLGSDIAMQLDECVRLPAERCEIERAMRLSLRWAERCKRAFEARGCRARAVRHRAGRRRREAARARACARSSISAFDGYAIGGLAVGEVAGGDARRSSRRPRAMLPAERPRYLMGVGTPADILEAVGRGIDMFDCVLPTRNGRHGLAFTRFGPINIKNAQHADDQRPLDAESRCPAARDFSRAYLHHLFRSGEALGGTLLSLINLYYYQDLMAGARAAISGWALCRLCGETKEQWIAQNTIFARNRLTKKRTRRLMECRTGGSLTSRLPPTQRTGANTSSRAGRALRRPVRGGMDIDVPAPDMRSAAWASVNVAEPANGLVIGLIGTATPAVWPVGPGRGNAPRSPGRSVRNSSPSTRIASSRYRTSRSRCRFRCSGSAALRSIP